MANAPQVLSNTIFGVYLVEVDREDPSFGVSVRDGRLHHRRVIVIFLCGFVVRNGGRGFERLTCVSNVTPAGRHVRRLHSRISTTHSMRQPPQTKQHQAQQSSPSRSKAKNTVIMAESGTGIQELMAAETRASQIVAEARIGG